MVNNECMGTGCKSVLISSVKKDHICRYCIENNIPLDPKYLVKETDPFKLAICMYCEKEYPADEIHLCKEICKKMQPTKYKCTKCGYVGKTKEHECNNPDDKKPPLGIMPEYIWKEKRAMDLLDTINRYVNAGWLPMSEWIEEYGRLVKEIEEKGKYKL